MGHEGNEANSPQMTEDAVREVIRERLDENVCVVRALNSPQALTYFKMTYRSISILYCCNTVDRSYHKRSKGRTGC